MKRSAVCDEMLVHEGTARIFESDEEATEAIKTGKSTREMSLLYATKDRKADRA